MPAGERLRLCMLELSAQGFVLALRCLHDLAFELPEIVLHASERRSGGGFEGGVHLRRSPGNGVHPFCEHTVGIVQRTVHGRRHLCLEQRVQGGFVLCPQRLEWQVVADQHAHGV